MSGLLRALSPAVVACLWAGLASASERSETEAAPSVAEPSVAEAEAPPSPSSPGASEPPPRVAEPTEHAKPEPERGRRFWTVAVQQDFAWLDGNGVCSPSVQSAGDFSCFRAQGSQYLGTPRAQDAARLGPGFAVATTRLMLEGQWLVARTFSVGARLGYVVRGGGPKPLGASARAFLPVHAELRAQWLPFGAPPRTGGVRPVVAVGVGLAQVDAHERLRVREDRSAPPSPQQLDNPDEQTLDVYKKLGTGFGSVGVGALGTISPRWLWRVGAQAMALWPASGVALALEAGVGFEL